jgi:predicted nucleic acid-binding Zn ribbon protein
MTVMVMRCYECGRVIKKVEDNPESYECECGFAIRRLTSTKSRLFVKMTIP